MNLPNREELLFRVVLALPKASKMGLAFKILDSKAPPAEVPKLSHKYFKMFQEFTLNSNMKSSKWLENLHQIVT